MSFIVYEGKEYEIGRVAGGVAWPGFEQGGYVAILGEERFPRIREKEHHIHLLDEAEEPDLTSLLKRCEDLSNHCRSKRFNLELFIGREDEINWPHFDLWCANSRVNHFITHAPKSDNDAIGYHVNTLKNREDKGKLHLPEWCKLRGYFNELGKNDVPTATDLQYPAIAALGYGVSYLTTYPPDNDDDEDDDISDVSDGSTVNPITGY